ncbi:hypothetical protein [Methylotenera sp.]|uniref:hypothetical protein n=1 Tax=Methylotenera sp. TaxID=2051956 RepID=UPI00248A7416|nr:hypothetical protein [Methylotenera sp.]MDI1362576.1 hypothetical protein [Methylotenera sp.]
MSKIIEATKILLFFLVAGGFVWNLAVTTFDEAKRAVHCGEVGGYLVKTYGNKLHCAKLEELK